MILNSYSLMIYDLKLFILRKENSKAYIIQDELDLSKLLYIFYSII